MCLVCLKTCIVARKLQELKIQQQKKEVLEVWWHRCHLWVLECSGLQGILFSVCFKNRHSLPEDAAASVSASSGDRQPRCSVGVGLARERCASGESSDAIAQIELRMPSLAGAGVVICNYNRSFCFCKSVCK